MRGSALVVAIFIISIVGSVAFGMGRLLFLENDMAAAYENGSVAFYAAESGLEEAFLLYRYDQNDQVPTDPTKIERNNIDTLISTNNQNLTDPVDGSQHVYDLAMMSDNGIGADNLADAKYTQAYCSDPAKTDCVVRDEVKTFKIDASDPNHTLKDVDFTFKPIADSTLTGSFFAGKPQCALIEAKIVGKKLPNGPLDEWKMIFYNPDAACTYINPTTGAKIIDKGDGSNRPYDTSSIQSYKIQKLKENICPTLSLEEAELTIRPIGAHMAFNLSKNYVLNPGNLYGATTRIQSSGYYGGVSQTLTKNIDRQSGSVYDLFDYVIYKAQ